jgi:hypothetical protein
MTSGFATGRAPSVRLISCPTVPAGFFSLSLEGGLPLLMLFNPIRRFGSPIRSFCPALSASNSATRAFSATFSARREAFFWRILLGAIPALIQIRPSGTRPFVWTESVCHTPRAGEELPPPKTWAVTLVAMKNKCDRPVLANGSM